MADAWIVAFFCITLLLVIVIFQSRQRDKEEQAHKERMFLWEQAERERNQLLNRSMAKDLNDYRQSVVVESQAKDDPEAKQRENLLDQAFGDEWREAL